MFDRRAVVLLFLCANVAFWVWSNGWLGSLGWAPATDSEPQRLSQQVTPYKLQLLKEKVPFEASAPSPSKP